MKENKKMKIKIALTKTENILKTNIRILEFAWEI